MGNAARILAFAGSTREGSFNKKLVQIAADGARAAGAEVTYIDLREYPMPLYDGDIEANEGFPESVMRLKKVFAEHDGLLIASPEYNSSISGVLKNTIDWISRPAEGEKSLAAFDGKLAGIMSTSPGGLGGLRNLVHLRAILGNIKVIVLPDQIAVPGATKAFREDGMLADEKKQEAVQAIGAKVAVTAQKLMKG